MELCGLLRQQLDMCSARRQTGDGKSFRVTRDDVKSLGADGSGGVAESWQAEFIKFAGLSFPNAFFGIAAESVFVTIAVIGLSKVVVPRWFALCTWLGGLAALAYAYWLFIQSMFVIRALCPWCLGLMFATTIQFMALSHATVSVQRMPAKSNGLRKYYRLNFDLMVDVVWIIALIVLIIVVDGPAIFLSLIHIFC